jgi:hypothetical protein
MRYVPRAGDKVFLNAYFDFFETFFIIIGFFIILMFTIFEYLFFMFILKIKILLLGLNSFFIFFGILFNYLLYRIF